MNERNSIHRKLEVEQQHLEEKHQVTLGQTTHHRKENINCTTDHFQDKKMPWHSTSMLRTTLQLPYG